MKTRQIIYTCSPWNESQGSGYGVFSLSEGISPKLLGECIKYCSYNVPDGMSFSPSEEELSRYPESFSHYNTPEGNYIIVNSRYLGNSWYNLRSGDFISHILVIEKSPDKTFNPFSLIGSDIFWRELPKDIKLKALDILNNKIPWEPPSPLDIILLNSDENYFKEEKLSNLLKNGYASDFTKAFLYTIRFLSSDNKKLKGIEVNLKHPNFLDFMESVYAILPSSLKEKFSFSTYQKEGSKVLLPDGKSFSMFATLAFSDNKKIANVPNIEGYKDGVLNSLNEFKLFLQYIEDFAIPFENITDAFEDFTTALQNSKDNEAIKVSFAELLAKKDFVLKSNSTTTLRKLLNFLKYKSEEEYKFLMLLSGEASDDYDISLLSSEQIKRLKNLDESKKNILFTNSFEVFARKSNTLKNFNALLDIFNFLSNSEKRKKYFSIISKLEESAKIDAIKNVLDLAFSNSTSVRLFEEIMEDFFDYIYISSRLKSIECINRNSDNILHYFSSTEMGLVEYPNFFALGSLPEEFMLSFKKYACESEKIKRFISLSNKKKKYEALKIELFRYIRDTVMFLLLGIKTFILPILVILFMLFGVGFTIIMFPFLIIMKIMKVDKEKRA